MFPGGAVMYWLGTRGVHATRATRASSHASLGAFHDAFLGYGALPIPMVASLLAEGAV
jgi:uncharacterized protein (DUF885 family)